MRLIGNGDDWKLSHLGPNVLGEMLGYARPEECLPRNARVVRTLRALGYDVKVQQQTTRLGLRLH